MLDLDDEVTSSATLIPSLVNNVESVYADRQLASLLTVFLETIPNNLRSIVFRHYWLGQTQTFIAEELGVTRSAVCHALARAHKLGREFFGVTLH